MFVFHYCFFCMYISVSLSCSLVLSLLSQYMWCRAPIPALSIVLYLCICYNAQWDTLTPQNNDGVIPTFSNLATVPTNIICVFVCWCVAWKFGGRPFCGTSRFRLAYSFQCIGWFFPQLFLLGGVHLPCLRLVLKKLVCVCFSLISDSKWPCVLQ